MDLGDVLSVTSAEGRSNMSLYFNWVMFMYQSILSFLSQVLLNVILY